MAVLIKALKNIVIKPRAGGMLFSHIKNTCKYFCGNAPSTEINDASIEEQNVLLKIWFILSHIIQKQSRWPIDFFFVGK